MDLSSAIQTDPDGETQQIEVLISELTYAKWVKAGKPPNAFDRFWEEAEREVAQQLSRGRGSAGGSPPK